MCGFDKSDVAFEVACAAFPTCKTWNDHGSISVHPKVSAVSKMKIRLTGKCYSHSDLMTMLLIVLTPELMKRHVSKRIFFH